MYNGDRARKKKLVEYGFRLPSAYDNRPLAASTNSTSGIGQVIYVSATPGPNTSWPSTGKHRSSRSSAPQGLAGSARLCCAPAQGQVDDLVGEIRKAIGPGVRRAGDHADQAHGGKPDRLPREIWASGCDYLHSGHATPWSASRSSATCAWASIDVLVGINLLREGLGHAGGAVWWPSWTRIRKASCAARPA